MRLGSLTRPELVFPALPGSDRPTVLRAFAERMAQAGAVDDADRLYRRLWEREELGSTAIGSRVAVPHCKLDGIDQVVLAVGISRQGVDFEAEDEQSVELLFLVVSPSDAPAAHLQCLAAISKWVRGEQRVDELLELDDPVAIHQRLLEEVD